MAFTLAFLTAAVFGRSAAADEPGNGPVQVFLLAGQSNMQGHGIVPADPDRNGGLGSLEHLAHDPATAVRFRHLVDDDGDWRVRDDVWIWYLGRQGGLTVGYGAREDRIGPELQFGQVLGDAIEAPVLIIKTAWGGKSLAVDFRPPSAGGETGPFYTEMVEHIREVLAAIDQHVPGYNGQGYKLAGFGWHQGWNDGLKDAMVAEYEDNLAHLIRDLRRDLDVPDLPVVIANSGFGGRAQDNPRRLKLLDAQGAVALRPEFRDTVRTVETRDFFRPIEVSPSKQGYHWNTNAETYVLIGDAMGRAMLELISER